MEISPECSLEELMLKLKLQSFDYLIRRTDAFERLTQRMFIWTIKAPQASEPEGFSPNPGSGCRRPRASRHSNRGARGPGPALGLRGSSEAARSAGCTASIRSTLTASCWAAAWSTAAPVHPRGLEGARTPWPRSKVSCPPRPQRPHHQGSPRILEWVAFPFSRGSSQPRNQTRDSCIAGGFFTN